MASRTTIAGIAAVALAGVFALAVRSAYVDERKQSEIATLAGFKVDYLMRAEGFAAVGGIAGDDFDVTSAGTVIVRSGKGMFEIDGRRSPPAAARLYGDGRLPESFALDSGDALLTVAERYLGKLEESGALVDGVPLPYDGMRLARTVHDGAVYLYGGDPATGYRLYIFYDSGELQVVLRLDQPIVAVADSKRSAFVATRNAVYRIAERRVAPVIRMDEKELGGPIVSIAATEDDALLFFATRSRIYAFRELGGVSIVNNSGGAIRNRGDRLVVLDTTRKLLYSLQPLGFLARAGNP